MSHVQAWAGSDALSVALGWEISGVTSGAFWISARVSVTVEISSTMISRSAGGRHCTAGVLLEFEIGLTLLTVFLAVLLADFLLSLFLSRKAWKRALSRFLLDGVLCFLLVWGWEAGFAACVWRWREFPIVLFPLPVSFVNFSWFKWYSRVIEIPVTSQGNFPPFSREISGAEASWAWLKGRKYT